LEDGPLIAPTYVLLKQINPPRTRSWRRLGARPQNGKIITYNGDMYDFYAWHAAMRPLINVGKVAYLPRFNDQWEGAKVRLPQLNQYSDARNSG